MATTSASRSFAPATRKRTRLRFGIDGPAGSGKTYTALRMAFALGRRVAVIDSEAGSASKYSGEAPDGTPWNFDVLELATFSPTEYTAAIEQAGTLGYDVVVVDSLSHAWQGTDGALELVSKKGGNSFTAWKDVTPMHTRMIESILRSPAHVIATMRSKVEYVLEKDTNAAGKTIDVPRRIGMAPIQRAGMEYEFDLYGSMDWSHILTITKSRCPSVDGAVVVKPGPLFLDPVIRWLESGTVTPPAVVSRIIATDDAVQRIVNKVSVAGMPMDKAKDEIFRRYTASEFALLTVDQAAEYERRLDGVIAKRGKAVTNGQANSDATATHPPVVTTAGQPAAASDAGARPVAVTPAVAAVPAAPVVGRSVGSPAVDASATTPPAVTTPARSTIQQHAALTTLAAEFFLTQGIADPAVQGATWAKVLAQPKYGVTRDDELSYDQAQSLICNLVARIDALRAERGLPPAVREPF